MTNPNQDKYRELNAARKRPGFNLRRKARREMVPKSGAFGNLRSTGRATDRDHYAELAVHTRGQP